MDKLKYVEQNVDKAEIFELLEFLKYLAILESDSIMMAKYEIMIVGLIERVQERIVLKWYK